MSVVEGIEFELAALPEDLRRSGFAAIARAMAERMDSGKGSPSECGKVAIDALVRLRDLAPPAKKEATRLDELTAKRAARRARAAH